MVCNIARTIVLSVLLAAQVLSDLVIVGPHVDSLLCSDGLDSMFVSGLLPGHFLYRLLKGGPDSWSSFNQIFAWKVLRKQCFRQQKVEIEGRLCVFCGGVGNSFFLIFSALATGLEI